MCPQIIMDPTSKQKVFIMFRWSFAMLWNSIHVFDHQQYATGIDLSYLQRCTTINDHLPWTISRGRLSDSGWPSSPRAICVQHPSRSWHRTILCIWCHRTLLLIIGSRLACRAKAPSSWASVVHGLQDLSLSWTSWVWACWGI